MGAGKHKTTLALRYLKEKGLIEKVVDGEKWKLRDKAFPTIEAMLSVYRKVKKKRPSKSVLRYLLASCPFRLAVFLENVKEQGFTRREGLQFLKEEGQRGYLKEAVMLLLGLQMAHLESFRFYARVRFVNPEEFRSFRARCEMKRLDFIEEEFLVGQYPPTIVEQARSYVERNDHRSLTQNPSTWFFVQEFRKRILGQPENPVYGVCY